MQDLVGSRRFRLTEAVRSRKLGKILGIPMYFQTWGSRGNTCFIIRCLNAEEPVLRDSGSRVFSTVSSFRPCAILAVDAIVSVREGWSSHDTRSVTSPSARSMTDALAALQDSAGLSLNDPFELVTAWWNSWYCADDNFLLDPSSSSPFKSDLSLVVFPGSSAAEKFTGDPAGDSEDEDLLTGDLERVELLDSSKSLHLLTGVLDLLAGAWDSLVLAVEGDLLTTRLSTGALSAFSGSDITVSTRLCINVIIDIKSNRLVWLISLGNDGKITLPSSEENSGSRPCWAGVCDLAGVITAGAICSAGSAPLPSRQLPSHHTLPGQQPCWVIILCRVSNHCRVCRPGRVVTCSWVGNLCQARHTCRVVLRCWTSWRLDDSNGPSLWLIRNGSCQVNLSSGHMSWPRMVRRIFLMASVMMLLGQGPVVDHSTRWRGQGPVVNHSPRLMMMMMGRLGIRSLIRSTCWSRMGRRMNTMLRPGAGPSRQGRGSGPLSTLMTPGRVTCPGDSWRLEDPWWWSLWPRSSLCEQWRSDLLVPDGPLDCEGRSTTDTMDETVLLDFSWDVEDQKSIALDTLDEAAVLSFPPESCCCRVDHSSFLLMGGACSPSLGARNSIESSIESCALFAAAAALRFCVCLTALSSAAHASGSLSL